MSDLSNYLENALVNHVLRNTAYTSPAAVYVGLFTAVTDAEAGTGTEVTGGSYARVAATFSAPSNGATSNSGAVTFPTATADWGNCTYFAIFDASSGGNALSAIKALTNARNVLNGDTISFATGELDWSFA